MRPTIFYFAAVLLLVLEGAWLVRGTNDTTPASNTTDASNTTMDNNSTSGMSGNETNTATMAPESSNTDSVDSSTQCLFCMGGEDSTCNSDSPINSSMAEIDVISGCRSCRIFKMDKGEGTPITQIVRSCDMENSCPDDLTDADDFMCRDNSTLRTCEWCCTGNKCNNFNNNGANGLVAAVIIGGWSITKIIYVVLSAMAVAMSMPTMG